MRLYIDRTMNVHSLATAVRLQMFVLATTNPTISGDAVMQRMTRIAEVDRIVFALGFQQFFVFLNKLFLLGRVKFSRNMLRFFVRKTKSVKQVLHAGCRVFHIVFLFDVMTNLLAREIGIFVKVLGKFLLLSLMEFRLWVLIVQGKKFIFATSLI